MFSLLLVILLVASVMHMVRTRTRDAQGIGRLLLLYVLVGYCGVPMLIGTMAGLIDPDWTTEVLRFPAQLVQGFFAYAYLGMSILACMALWYRGSFLIAPAVCWAVYFLGATLVHLQEAHGHGAAPTSHGTILQIFLTHTLISVILVGALLASDLLRSGLRAEAARP